MLMVASRGKNKFLKAFILSNNCSRICEYVRGSFLIKLVTYIPSKLIEQIYILQNTFLGKLRLTEATH